MAKNKDTESELVPLNTFVKEALLESLRAIKSAQEDEEIGGLVSPAITGNVKIDPAYGVAHHGGKMFTTMAFDLAVTAENQVKGKVEGSAGGSLLSVVSLKMGVSAEGSKKNEAVNRMQFAVHLELPQKKD